LISERKLTLSFDPPRKIGDREMVALNFLPPRVGWRQKAEEKMRGGVNQETQTQANVALVAKCGGVEPAVIEELYEEEYLGALTFVTSFAREPNTPREEGETTRTIEFPALSVDGREYTALMLTRTKIGHRRQAEGHLRQGNHPEALTKFAVHLVAKSAAVDERVIRELDDDFFFEAWSFVASFLAGGLGTGTS
jgi:hypothetical protein